MKYMRKTAGYTRTDYYKKKIAEEQNITPDWDRIQEYRRNWFRHTNRMPRNKLPRIKKKCRPTGRRNQGRP